MSANSLARVGLRILLAVILGLAIWGSARSYFVCCKWQGSSATYAYGSSLPSSFHYNVRTGGADPWTRVSTSSWKWRYSSSSTNVVRYRVVDSVPGGHLALTNKFVTGVDTIVGFEMILDEQETWYTGRATRIPSGSVDTRSIVAHEFGHAVGLKHAHPLTYCPGYPNDPTMCEYYTRGTTYMRTLELDDKNGVSHLYPMP